MKRNTAAPKFIYGKFISAAQKDKRYAKA